MKAVVMTGVGGVEVLQVAEVERPRAGVGELAVRVRACGVNPLDYKLRSTGAMGFGAGSILGFDIAGVVEEVGLGVKGWKGGEEVFYKAEVTHGAGGVARAGGYAEYQVVEAGLVVRKPGNLTFEEAAALPLAGQTAWGALFDRGELRAGESVLIAGANGGVGTVAVQMAKAAGAYVIGTCSTRSMEFVKGIPVAGPEGKSGKKGPDRVLNYQTEDWSGVIKEELGKVAGGAPAEGLDVVFDCVGKDVVSRSIGLMRPYGRIVSIVNPQGKLEEGYRKNVGLHFAFVVGNWETLGKVGRMAERGQVVPLVEEVMGLEEAGEAHRRLEAGGVKGKIVLRVG